MATIGIVIPAFRPDPDRLVDYIKKIREGITVDEIRVELDDPKSESVVEQISQESVSVATSSTRRGKGMAITSGFEELTTDIMMFLDADGSTPVKSVRKILDPIRRGITDISVGSRRHPESNITSHQTTVRRYLGDFFALAAGVALPVKLNDYQCGAKAITSSAWKQIRNHLYEDKFAWDIEMLSVASSFDLKISEIPITWNDYPGSTVDPFSTVFDFARALLTIRHRSLRIKGHPIHSALPQSNHRPLLSDD
ncbi:glycosyltransferase [Natronosalvus rutilus]|uniref:Glycosyltransferase n=1 Tax=Natronosalvus rutilus TaxID=2953753 RepID=A0A9E7N752_9EURY|nr:glycosyltransferase [Natronosalvus rutilus]UTF52740.1 glycosyltransferase [Natronosalvus rutilus]